jgi:uncharacterized protein YdeI (YjbR/CyaY-like superfamily)
LFSSKYLTSCRLRIEKNIFAIKQIILIGRKSKTDNGFLILFSGLMMISFHALGTLPDFMKELKIITRRSTISSKINFKNLGEIPSLPVALLVILRNAIFISSEAVLAKDTFFKSRLDFRYCCF